MHCLKSPSLLSIRQMPFCHLRFRSTSELPEANSVPAIQRRIPEFWLHPRCLGYAGSQPTTQRRLQWYNPLLIRVKPKPSIFRGNITRLTGANVFTRQQVWNGYESNIEGLIRDWVKWQNTPEKYPFEIFKKVLAEMSPPDMGALIPGDTVRIPNDSREIPTIKYPYGTVPVTNSSAGVGRIITLAYLIVWAWNEHKENCKLRGIKPDSRIVVMVDELEAHLHPKWQRTILPALIEVQKYLADELEVQFIIATHSPLIMASSESVFDIDTDKLFQIRLAAETSDAVVTEENFIKYGQVNAWLTSPIFNLNQARATGAEQAINEAKTLQLEDDPSDVEVQAVHQKLLQSLAQNDPFWPRWIYFAEQHGVTL